MQQASFADLAHTHKKKITRNERFLREMDQLLPVAPMTEPDPQAVSEAWAGAPADSGRGVRAHLLNTYFTQKNVSMSRIQGQHGT